MGYIDAYLGGVDADVHAGAVGLLPVNPVNVDHELLAVHGRDLALTVLVRATHHGHLVILADGEGAHLIQQQQSSRLSPPLL